MVEWTKCRSINVDPGEKTHKHSRAMHGKGTTRTRPIEQLGYVRTYQRLDR